ncbi:unnamed protein product [Gongylonema pulchrum]|uniref:SANT domain-containing protein n=1 Tax=Gongylonema pulchrum TaxID=637853 RepID=A0A183E148_9BILA|nr:unnamed protein product [Gongylonema pulchrum]
MLDGKSDAENKGREAKNWEEVAKEFEITSPAQLRETLHEAAKMRKGLKAKDYEQLRAVMGQLRNSEKIQRELRARIAQLRKESDALKSEENEERRARVTGEREGQRVAAHVRPP